MKHRTIAIAFSVGLLAGLSAPVLSAADKETRQMMADIRMLQEQTQQLQNLITTLRQAEDDPASMAVDAFMKALYRDHPYARKVRGTVAGIEQIRRQDLVRFHQKGFDPSGIAVVIVGDINEDAATAAVARLFGDWASPSAFI